MKTIFACIDFSPVTSEVVNTALRLTQALGAKLYLIHVASLIPLAGGFEPFAPMVDETAGDRLRLAREQLEEWCGRLRGQGIDTTGLLSEGLPVEEIMDQVARLRPDMIVIGSHGRGALFHLMMGSTAHGVLRKATCPVVVVPSPKPQPVAARLTSNGKQTVA